MKYDEMYRERGMSMDVLVYGAGGNGRYYEIYTEGRADINIISYIDRNPSGRMVRNHPVVTPDKIPSFTYDKIVIANDNAAAEIVQMLKDTYGVPEDKILMANAQNREFFLDMKKNWLSGNEDTSPRSLWLKDFARYAELHHLQGNVAEAGVYTGGYAHYINKYFPDRKLYLFDTFEGFDARDLEAERTLQAASFLQGIFNHDEHFDDLKGEDWQEIVLAKMIYPENIIFKKGYFPETAEGLEEKFVFVDLDMDLYQPMLAGLRVFYDKLVPGGVITCHDYFLPELAHGVQKAVEDFEQERGMKLAKMPIGDATSIAIVRI